MAWLVLAVIVLVLLALNALFVAAEFAVLSCPRAMLEREAAAGKAWAKYVLHVATDMSAQDRYIAVAQVGITLASLGLGMYGEHAAAHLLTPVLAGLGPHAAHVVASTVAVAFLTFWHIVAGEMVPKTMALMHPAATARAVILPMRVMGVVLAPLVFVLNHMGNVLLRMLGQPVTSHVSYVYTPEEMAVLIEESHEEGLLGAEEHRWMERLITFGERRLEQVMVPRVQVVGVAESATLEDIVARIREDGYTRYPVLHGDADHIVGMVHAKDVYSAMGTAATAADLLRPLPYLPESMPLDHALERMRNERARMAVVLDEHGGTAGIVTTEDLVENVFGEVLDEFDAGEQPPLEALEDGTWRARGDVALEDLPEAFVDALASDGLDSLNGRVVDALGRPPLPGDVVEIEGVSVEVEEVADNAVVWCRLRSS